MDSCSFKKEKRWNLFIVRLLLLCISMSFTVPVHAEVIEFDPVCPIHAGVNSSRKVLYVDSYHPEYVWVQEIMRGINSVFNIKTENGKSFNDTGCAYCLKVVHMDTKRNKTEAYIQNAARKVKTIIDKWQPDVIIASDDNASKYVIVPYLKDSKIPVVFCGVNWDCSVYGFPVNNITGMVEVTLVSQVIDILDDYAAGKRIGYIASNNITEEKNTSNIKKFFNLDLNIQLCNTVAEFKEKYNLLQEQTDIVLLSEVQSLKGFDSDDVIRFIQKNTRVPTGGLFTFLAPLVLVTCAATGVEQGEWAAQTALEILNGTSPADIPVVKNKKAKIYLNMTLAKNLGIKFPMDLIEHATFVEEEPLL